MTQEKYATVLATPFVVPAHPGLTQLIPPGTNQINARILTTQYKSLIYQYELCQNITNALKQQILNSIKYKYMDSLENQHTGCSNVSPV